LVIRGDKAPDFRLTAHHEGEIEYSLPSDFFREVSRAYSILGED